MTHPGAIGRVAARQRGCALCGAGLEHCHATAVVHSVGFWECSDDGCTLYLESHEVIVDCCEVDPRCCGAGH